MIYAITSGGRLGNQLMFAANMLASSLEYGVPYKNISFQAEKYFDSDTETYGVKNHYSKMLDKVLTTWLWGTKKLFGKAIGIYEILDNPERAVSEFKTAGRGMTFWHCWPYLDYIALYHQQDMVRKLIHPKEAYVYQAEGFFDKIRHQNIGCDVTIGLHVRRGDYKHWMDGRYYFEADVFRSRMEETASLMRNAGKKAFFILFTDEDLDEECFKSEAYDFAISQNAAIVDMIVMSMCDYLIGPPSTFSGWASFMGGAPKYIMLDREAQINDMSEFGVYMIDVMDDKIDRAGNKILTRIVNGYPQNQ